MATVMIRVYKDTNVTELTRIEPETDKAALRIVRYGGDLVANVTGAVGIAIRELLNGAAMIEIVKEIRETGNSWLAVCDRAAITKEWTVFSDGKFAEHLSTSELAERIRRELGF